MPTSFVFSIQLHNRAGTNIEIHLRIFANKMFEHSVLAFKLQVFLYLCTSFLSQFVNIFKSA